MNIPDDLYQEIVLSLPYKDIITLCQVDKKFNIVCDRNWKNLLKRDFGLEKNDRVLYIKLHNILNYFSDFPIITMKALLKLLTLSKNDWDIIIEQSKIIKTIILDVSIINILLDEGGIDIPYDDELDKMSDTTDIRDIIENGPDRFKSIIATPTRIFAHGEPMIVKYDIDYAQQLFVILDCYYNLDFNYYSLVQEISKYLEQFI
jgi:hypothetical protein